MRKSFRMRPDSLSLMTRKYKKKEKAPGQFVYNNRNTCGLFSLFILLSRLALPPHPQGMKQSKKQTNNRRI
jgi:hypothetical protein